MSVHGSGVEVHRCALLPKPNHAALLMLTVEAPERLYKRGSSARFSLHFHRADGESPAAALLILRDARSTSSAGYTRIG